MSDTCKNCRFFKPNETMPNERMGECRRHAPVVGFKTRFVTVDNQSAGSGAPKTVFALIYPDDWCGDFEEKRGSQ